MQIYNCTANNGFFKGGLVGQWNKHQTRLQKVAGSNLTCKLHRERPQLPAITFKSNTSSCYSVSNSTFLNMHTQHVCHCVKPFIFMTLSTRFGTFRSVTQTGENILVIY